MKNSIPRRLSLKLLPLLCSWVMRIWFSTCRINMHGEKERKKIDGLGGPAIGTFWHHGIIGSFYVLRNESSVLLVSASDDGEYIARLAHHFGLSSIRGSKNKRGTQALRELLGKLREGRNVGIVADGSQGPPMIAQAGAILLASKTGVPILPMVWSASTYFAINSWDRMILPKPFSRIDFYYGEPLVVPNKLNSEGIEEYRSKLEITMNSLYSQAWKKQGKHEH